MDRKALLSIFLLQEDDLMQKIAQAASARDLEGVRSTIARFFDTQLSPSGEYASQLTQAEFFILQSTAFVYDLQRKLDEQFILPPVQEATETADPKAKLTSSPMAFAYSIVGGLLGTWAGAPLAGAISGLILSTLLYKHQPDFLFVAVIDQNRPPASGAGIAAAGAVGVYVYVFHGYTSLWEFICFYYSIFFSGGQGGGTLFCDAPLDRPLQIYDNKHAPLWANVSKATAAFVGGIHHTRYSNVYLANMSTKS